MNIMETRAWFKDIKDATKFSTEYIDRITV